jgi:hypothetical protein
MFPLIWVGAALAAAFLTGCGRTVEEPPPAPKTREPSPHLSPPREEGRVPSVTPRSEAEAPSDNPSSKKMSASELKSMAEELNKCLKVQRRYGFSCPPPQELPPGCTCSEVDLPPELNPNTPQKIRTLLLPAEDKSSLPNI